MRILLVEPNLQLSHTISHFLKQFEVTVTQDAAGAIKLLDENKFDVVVSEHDLGYNNSFDLLYEMRSYLDLMTMPFILFSSVYLSDSVLKSQSLGGLNLHKFLYRGTTTLSDLKKELDRLNNKNETD